MCFRKQTYCGNTLDFCFFPLPDLQSQLCKAHPHKHPSTSRAQGHFLIRKDKDSYFCPFFP